MALRSERGCHDQAEAKTVRRRERERREVPRSAVRHLVGGPGEGPKQVFICDECVALCAEIMGEEEDES